MQKNKLSQKISRICDVCDAEHIGYGTKCLKCGSRLEKKIRRSAPSNEKRLKKKKVKNCKGNKKSYQKRKDARAASKNIQQKKGRMSRIYYCDDCEKYHLTKLHS